MTLTKRNCLLYFRNPGDVLLSLLGALMVLVVYALFLGDSLAGSFSALADGALFVNSWMLAGMCAIAPLSTSFSIVGNIITDRIAGVDRDFLASPVPPFKVVAGYLASGVLGSFLMSSAVLAVSFGWMLASGAAVPSALLVLQCLGVMALTCVASACITFFIATFIHKNGAYSTMGTIVGTLGGFLAGIYLPIGQLPTAMQTVVKLFPSSHAAVLLRTLFLEGMSSAGYAGLPTEAKAEIFEFLGVRFATANGTLPLWASLAALAGTAVLFFALSCFTVGRKRK